jgi:multidrug resistance protein, MATE family
MVEGSSSRDFVSALASSFRSSAPIAEEAIARDLAECSDEESSVGEAVDTASDSSFEGPGPTMYRRPSGVAYGASRPIINARLGPSEEPPVLTRVEKKQSRDAERSLLRDNHVLPPKHGRAGDESIFRRAYRTLFSTKVRKPASDEETLEVRVQPTEASPLLGGGAPLPGSGHVHEHLNEQWEAAVATGRIKTTWQRETKTITAYAAPLIVTFLLQYSINVTSIFAVGRIGKEELGAVSRE